MNQLLPHGRVMIVDDTPADLHLLKEMLSGTGKEVAAFTGGAVALEAAIKDPPDLILLDIKMPVMDGYQVCSRLKENLRLKEIPVIFLGTPNSPRDKVRAFRSGGADYLPKPFHLEEVKARVETHLHLRALRQRLENEHRCLERLAKEKSREIWESQMATIFALAKLAESRDDDSGYHLERVRVYCLQLATRLGQASHYAAEIPEEFVRCLHHAAPLHDIGKVAIPDSILLKPAALTADETEIMKSHTTIGADNLKAVRTRYPGNAFIEMGIEIARHHHEWWDGSGYPDGLVGTEIPISARIVALADSYDTLCNDRSYRKGLPPAKVKEMIVAEKGTHFDPVVVDAFLALEPSFREVLESLT